MLLHKKAPKDWPAEPSNEIFNAMEQSRIEAMGAKIFKGINFPMFNQT